MKFRPAKADLGEKRKQKWVTIAIGIFIIVIMATSVINLWGGEEEGTYTLLGNKYFETEQGFITYIGNRQIVLLSDPKELENISITRIDISTLNSASKIYISYNPEEDASYAIYNFKRNIPLAQLVVESCWEDNEPCKKLPIKTCSDASDSVAVILFRQANETSVTFENNCLVFEGKNLLKVVDRFIAGYYAKED